MHRDEQRGALNSIVPWSAVLRPGLEKLHRRIAPGRRPALRAWATGLLSCLVASAAEPSAADLAFFESRIRPLLADHCYACHSARAEKLKGGLRLDSPGGILKGGESGPALVPGDPEKSLLIKAVRHTDADLQMPPKNKRLSDRQIADLVRWVKLGAPWPAADSNTVHRSTKPPGELTQKDREWWAFQPIRRPATPLVNRKSQIANPIDAFVAAELEAKRLKANPPATRRELIRRAYFDLIGLPPSPEEVAAFEKDSSSDAWPRLIDHLLSRPQYGERWGRHWLDVARYAQSNGYERDGEKPEAWRYRDYVVKAFNEDKPYDQFIKEQIAGDELERVTFDSVIATGFQRLGVWDDEPDDKRMAEFDELDDMLSTTGSAFLGLTIGCARCHDHKFDPIPQADYYRLLSFFRNVRLNENVKHTLDAANYVPLAEPARVTEWRNAHEAKLKPLQERLAAARDDAEKKKLSKQIEDARAEPAPFEFALAVRERGPKPPPTQVLVRGNAGSPGAEVSPAFLTVLGAGQPSLPEPPPGATSAGRRRALAAWIASPENPLTARVMVNRIWQHHFGRGLVKTSSDFGHAGTPPTHPKLLDWLAAGFIENGWSVKKLHKTILLSQTYQRSSRADNATGNRVDPGNELFWRQNLRRLEAEALRDTMLAISGRLNPRMGGRGFFPRLSGEVLAGQSRPGLDWEISGPEELSRRSLYAYVRRTMSVPMLDAFDYSNTTSPLSERPTTTVAPQALLMLNDQFMQEQAAALIGRLERECSAELRPMGDPASLHPVEGGPEKHLTPSQTDALIQRGFQLAVGRDPTKPERQIARDFIDRQEKSFAALRTRLTLRPDVPTSLSVSYMDTLKPEHFLIGPQAGWSYHRGRWSGAYEGIRTMERDRGPFALAPHPEFSNGVIEATAVLHTACESAGLLVRASTNDHELRGYEIALEPREQRVALRRHGDELTTLARSPAPIPTGRGVAVKIEVSNARLRVWLGGASAPAIDVTDPKPILAAGRMGARTWGAALSLENLVIRADGLAPVALCEEQLDPPERRALQAFCLLLLNLNEVVYVD
jgi:mono/diheme cytochrome c family protein